MWTESTEIEIALMVTFAVTTMTLMTVVKGAILMKTLRVIETKIYPDQIVTNDPQIDISLKFTCQFHRCK